MAVKICSRWSLGWLAGVAGRAGGHRSDRVLMDCAIHLDAIALDRDRRLRIFKRSHQNARDLCAYLFSEFERTRAGSPPARAAWGSCWSRRRRRRLNEAFLPPPSERGRVTFEISTLDCDLSRPPSWESLLRSRRTTRLIGTCTKTTVGRRRNNTRSNHARREGKQKHSLMDGVGQSVSQSVTPTFSD